MYFGADYYPEHWDENMWESHAIMMEEAGLNTVRLAEFAWDKMEPREGEFDFEWLDKSIKILSKHGVGVILGTPTAAPPTWLLKKYDVVMRDRYGRKRAGGSRRECCSNNMEYQRLSDIIVDKMAEHYAHNSNVVAWQIDNEFGCHASTRCYCESCRKAFARHLENKFGTIEEVNKHFGTVFWSLGYDSFEDIILPAYTSCEPENGMSFAHNPTLDMEYRRFSSEAWVTYQNRQINLIHQYMNVPVTHNMMGNFSDINYYHLGKQLDFVSWDNYPDTQWGRAGYLTTAMAHETMYGVKNKNFVVMEEQSGPCGWDIMGSTPRPGEIRFWAYQALAHGASGIIFFRFMAARFGMEQYWYGILDHDGVKRRRYYEIADFGKELKRIGSVFENSMPDADCLIVKSYDNGWAHEIKRHAKQFSYHDILAKYYEASAKLGVTTAIGEGNYDNFKVVIAPALQICSTQQIQDFKPFVKNGGNLVLTFRSGTRDEDNNMLSETIPGPLRELAGIHVDEFDAPRGEVRVSGSINGKASVWCDVISPDTARVIAVYASEYYQGTPAVTVNDYGKGHVYYVACNFDEESVLTMVEGIFEQSGVKIVENLPYGVEVIRRKKGDRRYVVLLNSNENPVSFDSTTLGYNKTILGSDSKENILEGYEVRILEN